jgi:hypothetical protein
MSLLAPLKRIFLCEGALAIGDPIREIQTLG